MSTIIIGEGSYGKILYDKDLPNIVSKLHYLSSYEQESGCDDIFKHEYKFHNLLYQYNLYQINSLFIIPKPINYKRITQHIDACIYNMEKLNYPSIKLLETIIKPEKNKYFKKTNPENHPPPYLLFSALSNDYENGKVKLNDINGVEEWNKLFYIIYENKEFAETMMNQFFELTIENNVILQDVEFLLSEKDEKLCIGMIDFNQVSDFETRYEMANRRIPNYSLEYDIANTYLFLSGIDTGLMLTDRNTQWKFLPTPHILPHLFFTTMEKIILQYSYAEKIFDIICSTIYKIETDLIEWNLIFDKIMIWHEILIYGAIDTELFDKLNIKYDIYDENIAKSLIKNYIYFSNIQTIELSPTFDEYYILKSESNQNYLEQMKKKQKIGLISKNILSLINYYDIMFQRFFIIKCLHNIGINNINIKKLGILLDKNRSFDKIITFILKKIKK